MQAGAWARAGAGEYVLSSCRRSSISSSACSGSGSMTVASGRTISARSCRSCSISSPVGRFVLGGLVLVGGGAGFAGTVVGRHWVSCSWVGTAHLKHPSARLTSHDGTKPAFIQLRCVRGRAAAWLRSLAHRDEHGELPQSLDQNIGRRSQRDPARAPHRPPSTGKSAPSPMGRLALMLSRSPRGKVLHAIDSRNCRLCGWRPRFG